MPGSEDETLVRRVKGGDLGAFELRVDDYALPLPSSREKLVFGAPRNGARSNCDLVVDLSGGAPLFPAHELRSVVVTSARAGEGKSTTVVNLALAMA